MSSSLMASLSPHLPTLLFIFILLSTSIIDANFAQSSHPLCPSFDCGNGVVIRYPFWHQNNQQQFDEHCGYAGFNVSCDDQTPILSLADDIYNVKAINYSDNTITLSYIINQGNCPSVSRDVTLTTSLFNYTADVLTLHFFYNCTLYPPALPFIECLQYGDKRSYVFMAGAIPEFDWRRYCESIVTAPVIEKTIDGRTVNGFSRAVQDGFKLRWRADGVCQSCEATGGFCGYGNSLDSNFFCLCDNGRHVANCDDKGVVSVKSEPNLAVMGALIFGGLIVAATIFYFIQRRKLISSHKPVFSRIPNIGK